MSGQAWLALFKVYDFDSYTDAEKHFLTRHCEERERRGNLWLIDNMKGEIASLRSQWPANEFLGSLLDIFEAFAEEYSFRKQLPIFLP